MKIAINLSWTSRMAAALLAVSAYFPQAEAAITSTQCAADGGVENFGNCYLVDATARTWSGAEATAQALGPYQLVSIHSAAENTYVNSLFTPSSAFWIGLSDTALDGTFAWSDGSPFDYSNWLSGFPVDNTGVVDVGWIDNPTSSEWLTADIATGFNFSVFSAPLASTVPVPAAVWLFGSGLLGLAGVARRKQNRTPAGSS